MLESELEILPELESEFETELDNEYEFEAFPLGEYEDEFESESEAELEEEAFFGKIAALARKAIQSPALRRAGLAAARTALGGLGNLGSAIGGLPGSTGARTGGVLGAGLGRLLSDLLPQQEGEFEYEEEFEEELNPIRRIYPDALMEHVGHVAANTESEAEAESFVGALVPLAAKALPAIARVAARALPTAKRAVRTISGARRIMRSTPSITRKIRSARRANTAIARVTPNLVKGVSRVTRMLRRSPSTRPLVRMLPTVVQRTVTHLGSQAAQGKPVTPQTAIRTLAAHTNQVISSPQQVTKAYQRSRALDQRFHRIQRLALREVTLRFR